jgi:hypothetical protein
VTAFRLALAQQFHDLRRDNGVDLRVAAGKLRLLATTLERLEDGSQQPTMLYLIRLCGLYGKDPYELLESAAKQVRPDVGPAASWRETALLLFSGVAPEQMRVARRRLASPLGLQDRLAAGESLSDIIVTTRPGDPVRDEAAKVLRGYYEEGNLSIRQIRIAYVPGVSFGTIRTLLKGSGVQFR